MTTLDSINKTKYPVVEVNQDQMLRVEGNLPKYKIQLDEEVDDVKEMNKRMMLGKVQYIRDKQVEENNALEAEYVNQ